VDQDDVQALHGHWHFVTDGDSSAVARHAISADLGGNRERIPSGGGRA